MDRHEYRSKHRESRATGAGIALVGVGGLDLWAASAIGVDPLGEAQHVTAQTLAQMHLQAGADLVAGLPGGSGVAIAAGVLGLAGGLGHRRYRTTYLGRRRRMLHHSDGWATLRDFARFSGATAARRAGIYTRHRMSAVQRRRAPITDFGMVLGRAITGPIWRRRHRVVADWQHGVLVLGEPGSRKSRLLANTVLDHPGPLVAVSTKSEFYSAAAEVRRAQRGPVRLFAPTADLQVDDENVLFSWDLVEGCRDAATAERRAEALMAAAAGAGLQNGDFWASKGRALFKSLLVAADLDEVSLREVARWLQQEDYTRPLKVLEHHQSELEPSLISGLRQYADSGAQVTASSAAHTAAQVVEFLSDPRVADALAPPRGTGMDMEAFLEANGTLFIVTGDGASMGPVVNSLITHVAWQLKQTVVGTDKGHDPPLGIVVDEAHRTMPSVRLHDMAAELRGWGVWMAVAAQNRAQLVEKWGAEAARTLESCLQTTVICGAHTQDDREHYSSRMGTRREVQVTESISDSVPAAAQHNPQGNGGNGLFGGAFASSNGSTSGTSTQFQTAKVPVFPPEAFMDLRGPEAVVIPNQGRPAVVQFDDGIARGEALTEKLRARRVAESERAAARERVPDETATASENSSLEGSQA